MKIKNISLTLLILFSLVFLSFSFYIQADQYSDGQNNIFDSTGNNTADSNGGRFLALASTSSPDTTSSDTAASTDLSVGSTSTTDTSGLSLTDQMAEKITELTDQTDNSQDQDVSLQQIQDLVSQALNTNIDQSDLPTVNKDDIKILKQNYGKLSASDATARKKQDFLNYLVAVYYIISSNSPTPLTSNQNITTVSAQITNDVFAAIDSGNTQTLDELGKSGDKMLSQLKDVQVPEDEVDMHIKAMTYALYAKNLEKYITPNADDPLGTIANFSKVEGYISNLADFSQEVGDKMTQYNVTYDDISGAMKNNNIEPIQDTDLINLLSQPD